ncbi:PEP-CTERM sorting domain-containing protein [Cerasicoccus fimbriatus]|uniref:PEP-CTERM sorting domain-containing protein n=1 Tax=Cerasicoccus fimbriatus TaxID=3014554 RepID=UPI0022B4BAF9|nr:PEP-CTERM sorting domain-containing protein [Cerasicoccus sp. TK19100]
MQFSRIRWVGHLSAIALTATLAPTASGALFSFVYDLQPTDGITAPNTNGFNPETGELFNLIDFNTGLPVEGVTGALLGPIASAHAPEIIDPLNDDVAGVLIPAAFPSPFNAALLVFDGGPLSPTNGGNGTLTEISITFKDAGEPITFQEIDIFVYGPGNTLLASMENIELADEDIVPRTIIFDDLEIDPGFVQTVINFSDTMPSPAFAGFFMPSATFTISTVPEPSTYALILGGAVFLFLIQRKHNSKHS